MGKSLKFDLMLNKYMNKMGTKLVYVMPKCTTMQVTLDDGLAALVPLSVKLTYTAEWEEDPSANLQENTQEVWIEW